METARCKAFIASVEMGSFSKAAEELGYTPSGVSQLVNAFEGELGFSLLHRNKRGVSPTANGEIMIPVIREFLGQEKRMQQMAAGVKGLSIGSVTIASYTSISTHWLPDIIKTFQDEYPQIHITLIEGTRQEVSQWMAEKRADVGFLSYQEPMEGDWIPLAEDRMMAILPKSHPLAGGSTYPLEKCQGERFIMPALGKDVDVITMLEEHNIVPDIRFATLESFSALSMIERDLGMSIMNELITRNWECDVVKMPVDPPQQITLGITIPSLKDAAPAVKRFVEVSIRKLTVKEK